LTHLVVDVGKLVLIRVAFEAEVCKSKRVVIVQLFLRMRVSRIAIEHSLADVDALRSQGDIISVRRRTHGKEKSAAGNKLLDFFGDRELQLRYFVEAVFAREILGFFYLFYIPRHVAELAVEFPV